jgi:hypothetical protein
VAALDVGVGEAALGGAADGAAVVLGDGREGMQAATVSRVAAVSVTRRMRRLTPARDA